MMTDRDIEIVSLHVEGLNLQAIGARMGISRERVRQILVHAGITDRNWFPPKPPKPKRVLDVSRKRLDTLLRAEEGIHLYKSGLPYHEIANQQGTSFQTVFRDISQRVNDLDLRRAIGRPRIPRTVTLKPGTCSYCPRPSALGRKPVRSSPRLLPQLHATEKTFMSLL